MHTALKNLATLLTGIGLIAGSAGCYVPGGGWTLRSGVDVRTGHKPAAFIELVDTKWDEWNRVSQMNMYGAPVGVPTMVEPIPAGVPLGEPVLAPASASSRAGSPSDSPPSSMQRELNAPPLDAPPVPGPTSVEEVPAPPRPANASARLPRDRFRRSQNALYQPQSNRANLLPAVAGRNPQPPVRDEQLEDRGPVTIDLPESVPQPPAADAQESDQEPNDYRRLVAPSAAVPAGNGKTPTTKSVQPSVRANRPSPQNRLQGQRTPSTAGAWLFARP